MVKKTAAVKKLKLRIEEQFRTLRANIKFSSAEDAIKTIVVTSCLPSEGKSTVISNLASSMAKDGKSVIILDCDLRKPSIHKKFSLSNYKGLTNILVERKNIEWVITSTQIPNVFVVPSGPIPPNPSELLSSKSFKEIINELADNFDLVLIDSPPVLYVSDAQILSALAQGTIIVTAYGKTEKKALVSAKENIEKAGGKILGVVINKIPDEYNEDYGYYYGER